MNYYKIKGAGIEEVVAIIPTEGEENKNVTIQIEYDEDSAIHQVKVGRDIIYPKDMPSGYEPCTFAEFHEIQIAAENHLEETLCIY